MLEQAPSGLSLTGWAALAVPGAGVLAAALVVVPATLYGRWRRKRRGGSKEEDLSWEDLLELLRRRRSERKQAGLPPDEDTPEDDFLQELLAGLPAELRTAGRAGTPEDPWEDLPFVTRGGVERRAGRRRWGNPTEVHVTSPLSPDRLHGLVINRSTGGLALLIDQEVPAGTVIKVRSAEAPESVPGVEAEVRYCRKAGKNFLVGCQFSGEVPWNVRVWFG